jgi:hypothetical protein
MHNPFVAQVPEVLQQKFELGHCVYADATLPSRLKQGTAAVTRELEARSSAGM